MAIARVLAVKRFRRHLMRLQHPEVANWTERELKNAVFRNGKEWMDLLRWLLGELDIEIKECLGNCSEVERISRVKESILVLGLSCPDKINKAIQGRVTFKEREELVSQLIDLVKMKKAIDSGGTACVLESEGVTSEDVQMAQKLCNNAKEKTDILSGRELFDLLLDKHPEYQRLMLLASNESGEVCQEAELSEEEDMVDAMDKMKALTLLAGGTSSITDDNGMHQCAHPEVELPNNSDPTIFKNKIRNCSCKTGESSNSHVPGEMKGHLKTPGMNVVTKEVCGADSADTATINEPSLPLGWHNVLMENCDEVPIGTAVQKSGADAKSLQFVENVHELVDDLENSFQISK